MDTSLDEVYLPCSDMKAIPSSPSQLEWKIGLPWAKIVEAGIPGHNLRIPPQLKKKHVVPPSSQDEALSHFRMEHGTSLETPGISVFPWSETGMSGNFGGRIKGAKYRFVLQDGTWDFS